ncbi:sugar O-acetyltransferase [Coraliomargarita akajimensis]|uniref:Acetyltransferase n=1 Tax=Coraliomargarita akajimensis (strain DSM 45221 / IAM 15411 / JCM 23193 / KCTC 12865 / 04OKA010-24) TaxID=583355 RepID=D5ELT4_CORAD|nr:sugar O-acetyltransferase [Coraliomargarita akajimensis]ADE53259.1 transferase hexapeptide repeat containing protein [Coraliomargarita akajimensis DSM 45221]
MKHSTKSDLEKMLAGEYYKSFTPELFEMRQSAKERLHTFNNLPPRAVDERNEIIRQLLGETGESFFIEPPFRCDYGCFIKIGENFYSNFNLVILDCAQVTIGKDVMIGPNVALYAATHPVDATERNDGWEYAREIQIGDGVWIGGNAVINPGVRIGDNTVIGAGSVVTKDIPANCVAAGNPCKVIRQLDRPSID